MSRIGIDAHVLVGKYQGSRTYLENLLREIGRQDKENEYIIFSSNPDHTRKLFPFKSFKHISMPDRRPIFNYLVFWTYATRRYQIDVIITQYIIPPFVKSKRLVIVHDIIFESHPHFFPFLMRLRLQIAVRWSIRRSSRILTVSNYTFCQIKKFFPIEHQKIAVVRNGAPIRLAPTSEALEEAAALKPYVLCVGRLEARKNITLVLSATKELRASGLNLVIVGSQDHGVKRMMKQIEASTRVVLLSSIDSNMLAALYIHTQMFVFPSFAEGFGLPVLEALTYGASVVASNQTAIPEVGGECVRYFDPYCPQAVSKLASLITDDKSTQTFERIQKHLQDFSWAESAKTIINLLKDIVAR